LVTTFTHQEHRVRSIENRAGPEDDLDVVDEPPWGIPAPARSGRTEERLVDGVAVDEKQK